MAGSRPAHLSRRGAVYQVRYRLPDDLAKPLGMAEFRRSLQTSDFAEAKRRCLAATHWFRNEVNRLRRMKTPTRADLEEAAIQFFERQANLTDAERDFGVAIGMTSQGDIEAYDLDGDWEIFQAQEGIDSLDRELKANKFSATARMGADDLTKAAGIEFETLPDKLKLAALQLAAQALRESTALYIHRLTAPATRFVPSHDLFDIRRGAQPLRSPSAAPEVPRPASLLVAGNRFREYTAARKVKASALTELERALRYLADRVGPETFVHLITVDDMMQFRDDLQRVDTRLRGRKVPFDKRLTDDPEHKLAYQTAVRYWRSIQAFFAWCEEGKSLAANPTLINRIPRPTGLVRKSPPPFTVTELQRLTQIPLYAGYASQKQVMVSGSCHTRGGKWWSGMLLMFTGMRAGELSQLYPANFDFDAPVPFFRITDVGGAGAKTKSIKSAASKRDVPIHSSLIVLGLREFVDGRAKKFPTDRLFSEFRLGTNGRKSEGATRFWGDLLRKYGLWEEGRATHVWRHTLAYFLRDAGAAEEDVQVIVGHRAGVTGGYGGQYPLSRKLKTLEKLDFKFDVVAAVGGPYNPKIHRS